MRRKDREVTDPARIADIISRCSCCRIGFCDDGEVYIVPLDFRYEKSGDTYTLYFHGAKEGRKMELLQRDPRVGFEMDTGHDLIESDGSVACGWSTRFQSVIGNGVMSVVSDPEEKRRGLTLLMEHRAGKREWSFQEKELLRVAVLKLTVTKMSCKEHP